MAGNLLAIPGVLHPPTHPLTGAHRGAHHEILAGELRENGEGERTGRSTEEEKGGKSFTCVLEI